MGETDTPPFFHSPVPPFQDLGLQAMRRTTVLVMLWVGFACLFLAGRMHPPLLRMREDYHLNLAAPLENTPPLLAFTTVALGGFRGVLTDVLWLRAARLQEEGKYFDAGSFVIDFNSNVEMQKPYVNMQ